MLRKFTKSDWDAFAGAEVMPNGDEPLIGESDVVNVVVSGGPDDNYNVETIKHETQDFTHVEFEELEDAVAFAELMLKASNVCFG